MMAVAMRELHIALLGYGYAGKTFHLPLLSQVKGLHVTRVVSSKSNIKLPALRVTAVADDVFADTEVDLVVIATPNDTHFELAQRALQAGKHVVVDKPFTTTVAEARELVLLAKKAERVLSVFHNRRWDADFLTVKRLIAEKVLGEVMHFESHFDRYRPQVQQRWRERPGPGSGVWFDLGSHLADQALQLFGAPESIYADMAVQREGATTTDYFHVLMRYGNRRVILHAGSLVAAETARFTVHGTQASYSKYGFDIQEDALKRGDTPGQSGWGEDPRRGELVTTHEGALRKASLENIPGNYLAYYQGIRDTLSAGRTNPVPAEDGLQVMAVLETAIESAKLRRELPFQAAA